MPYNYTNGCWEYAVEGTNGRFIGIIRDGAISKQRWTGLASRTEPFEVLSFYESENIREYLIICRHDMYDPAEDDYCRKVDKPYAAKWLERYGYDLPDDLLEYASDSVLSIQLSKREECIFQALGSEHLKGQTLAKRAGYPFNGSFRQTLSALTRHNILGNDSEGYFITTRYLPV